MLKFFHDILLFILIAALAASASHTKTPNGPQGVDCTWGQVKCCAANQCVNSCCPTPKDPG